MNTQDSVERIVKLGSDEVDGQWIPRGELLFDESELRECITKAIEEVREERDREWYAELLKIKADMVCIDKVQRAVDRATGIENYRPTNTQWV